MSNFIKNLSEISKNDVREVGGKGVNLAELTSADFLVPSGFCITTEAYQGFIKNSSLGKKISSEIEGSDLSNIENIQKCGVRLRQLIMDNEIPEGVKEAILLACRELPGGHHKKIYVAVRSSATAEDLPNYSFAGQHDTWLNIFREPDLLLCVKKCWASLWTDRAISYRHKNNVDHLKVFMAVVVQKMVPSSVSGITFTHNPITHNKNELIINANWGLGESVVSGKVSPDEYTVDKKNLSIKTKNTAEKKIMTILGQKGSVEVPVPLEQRQQQCVSDEQIQQLAAIGKRIEEYFHCPQDIEWGLYENQIFILQSRPITTMKETPESIPVIWGNQTSRDLLKDKVVFWSNWNTRETMPYPLTTLACSYFMDIIFPVLCNSFFGITKKSSLYPYNNLVDLVYGRLYFNMNMLYGNPIFGPFFRFFLPQIDKEAGKLFNKLYRARELQPVEFPKGFSTLWFFIFNATRIFLGFLFVPWFLSPKKIIKKCNKYWQESCEFENVNVEVKSNIEMIKYVKEFTTYTVRLWASSFLAMAHGVLGYGMLDFLTRQWKDVSPDKLVAGIPGNKNTEGALELYKLSQMPESIKQIFLNREIGEISSLLEKRREGKIFLKRLEQFMELYGHRGVKEFDIGHPRWKDDHSFVFQMIKNYLQLDSKDITPLEHFKKMAEKREHLTELVNQKLSQSILSRLFPLKRWLFKKMLKKAHTYMPLRENPKYYVLKCYSGSRRIFLEIGRRLAEEGYFEIANEVYFLTLPELEALVLEKDSDRNTIKNLVQERKEEWETNLTIDPPFIVRSDGKMFSYSEHEPQDTNILKGTTASRGRVTGKARIILNPTEGCVFNKGEILVVPYTDPGWTPLFLTAKALVMEVGGVASHGAIVAREYGIPAVVGVKDATRIIKNGDKITVDGDQGMIFL